MMRTARRSKALAAAAVTAGLVLTGCGSDDGSDSGGDANGDAEAAAQTDAEGDHEHDESGDDHSDSGEGDEGTADSFGHIHGLGATDDGLYVATHFGLFTVADEQAARVSEDDHDFMGFTMAGADRLLASGHPNSRTDLPGNLGLLESTDGGQTWTDLSLSGEVDFHALDAKQDMIYGLDSGTGQLMSSNDGKNWERLGQVALADVTINPDDAKTVLITTEEGPQISTNGGAEFSGVDGAPVIMLADWPRPKELYGVGPAGAVHRSTDGGQTWKPGADLGERPQAMTVGADGAVYVALETSIVVSTDEGQTFSDVYTW